jgi:CRISPR-associated endonuclease/helicase Cas3
MAEEFWAKTDKGDFVNGSPKYHSVICHLADTAAVAMTIVRDYLNPMAVKRLGDGLNLHGESLIRFCGFIAGCHDLGKISPVFQFQRSDVAKALAGQNLYDLWFEVLTPEQRVGKAPHGTITAKTLPEYLIGIGLGSDMRPRHAKTLAQKLAIIVGGHHGFFPSQTDLENLNLLISGINEGNQWQLKRYRENIFQQLQEYVGLTAPDLPNHCDNAAAMILAGLTTVSDWIASNPDNDSGFPYADNEPFDNYKKGLAAKAKNALEKIGWTKQPPSQPLEFTELFAEIRSPRPLQEEAMELTKSLNPPCFILIEALMGEGKTEAALYLADYLQHQSSAGGFYIGLPTQATSNAMWERVQKFLKSRYPGEKINLMLSHSSAALQESYQQTVCRLDEVHDEDGVVGASEWHTARKRTMLSPYGVGTVDQGLMGIVRSKHQFVRLFGLAGRTIIIDEIHAYDLYTSTLLESFLEWLALLGSPVIALSATLPLSTRKKLMTAYARGCKCDLEVELPTAPYPRITTLNECKALIRSFAASPDITRTLNIKWVQESEWQTELKEKLANGGCAAIICSTVDRAQRVFRDLERDGFAQEELGLFHGRFLFTDREEIETQCLEFFGKDSTNRPHRYVLIATQVIEQSLDVDFDLMISDIAPIDLLLQRSGRLHRHAKRNAFRPEGLKAPTLWIIAPTLQQNGMVHFADSRYIYDRHILLRTWLTLRDKNSAQLPADMDELIESVYELDMLIPSDLEAVHQQDWEKSLAKYWADEIHSKGSQANAVKLPQTINESSPSDFTRHGEEDDERTLSKVTRLGETSVTTIFLQRTPAGLMLPFTSQTINLKERPDLPKIRALLAHSTRINKRDLVDMLLTKPDPRNPSTWTSALLKHCRLVILDEEGRFCLDKWEITLDKKLGVVIRNIGGNNSG